MHIRHDQLTRITELSSLGLYLVTPAPAKSKTSFLERLGNFWCRLYAEPMPAPRTCL